MTSDANGASQEGRADAYSEASFWDKVRRFAAAAGRAVIGHALILYFALLDRDTPVWAKSVITGALAYFILPVDAIPDAIPVVGFSDDLGALAAALGAVETHVKPEHRRQAEQKLSDWFGEGSAENVAS